MIRKNANHVSDLFEAPDTKRREIRKVQEYPDGTRLHRVFYSSQSERETEVGWEVIELNDGEFVIFTPWETKSRWSGKLEIEIKKESDQINHPKDEGLIPVEIATRGRPAIASYLHAIHGFDKQEIAEKLDVQKETVRQYWHRYIAD